ncbi:MAG: hypothetical protein ABI893_10685 [Polaromonas sp.]|uniref:hypothetical protein n=1 Tax=Polaromonas sp. TaxID=1869339 RepID=UPI003265B66A
MLVPVKVCRCGRRNKEDRGAGAFKKQKQGESNSQVNATPLPLRFQWNFRLAEVAKLVLHQGHAENPKHDTQQCLCIKSSFCPIDTRASSY